MLMFLFTAIIFLVCLIAPVAKANFTDADRHLIDHVANSPVVTMDSHELPHSCHQFCSFIQNNGTSGGDRYALFLTTPTCLYCPFLRP